MTPTEIEAAAERVRRFQNRVPLRDIYIGLLQAAGITYSFSACVAALHDDFETLAYAYLDLPTNDAEAK
jgi:hypothetical protein